MFVVVELPAECDKNDFKITIVRKDQREDLAVQKVRWSRQNKSFGYEFNPSEIAAAGGGVGEYEIKFYSGPDPVIRKKFKIR
jgi:hypothetical protein